MTERTGFNDFLSRLSSPALRAVAEHWHYVRLGKLMPNGNDLASLALAPHFSLLWGFHYNAQTDDFTGWLAGGHIKEWVGANFWGARLQDIHPPHVVSEARRFLGKVLSGPAAGRCSGSLFITDGKTVTGERIALPLSDDGITANGILGASAYEQVPRVGKVELIHENMEWFGL